MQGYGANDLDRDERDLLSNTESRKAIAVLKRPFMVVQLGENLVQVCERVLAAVRAASASDAQGPQLHANLRSGDASATSTNNANRLARLTAIRKVCTAPCNFFECHDSRIWNLSEDTCRHEGILHGIKVG